MKFIDLDTQYQLIKHNVNNRIQAVLESGQFVMGHEITELEQRLAKWVGVKHCIAVANGSDALLIAMLAIDLQPGDEIITSAFSFIAVAEMAVLYGIKPVLVDVDPETYNLKPSAITAAITPKTKAIIPVSLYGQCADFDEINHIAKQYQLPVIEDAAQSIGATYKGKQSASLTTIATTSFFPSKPLGCYGDGGACFTQDDKLALKMQQIRNHGQAERYQHVRLGMNSRLDTIQAAVLLTKLEIFAEEIKKRQQIAANYNSKLKHHVKIPIVKDYNTSVYAQYTIQVEQRSKIYEALNTLKIPTAIHYPVAIHKQPYFRTLVRAVGEITYAERLAEKVLSLPMHPYLEEADIEKICTALIRNLQ
ncbi:MAG: aminotransferase DegT [Gammaproteobacteria bacterium RIFCSPHIGHO2_12_FULL_35_23]|nr:MAG: aminotransferase DegT [Gammaproteobacteria bacterium RIFCSPHIGHO2_12_FULL_35_23]